MVIDMLVSIIFVEILLLFMCLVIFGIKLKCKMVNVRDCVIIVISV